MSLTVIRMCAYCGEEIKASGDDFDDVMKRAREAMRTHRREHHGENNPLW